MCDEKTEGYANYLRQLISTNDDKEDKVVGLADGSVDAAVWLETDYLANKVKISSNEHILFVGNTKASKSETSSMIVRFEKFGMKYGWLGKRGMMVVDNDMLKPEEYDQFIELCLGYETTFEKIAMKKSKLKELVHKPEGLIDNKVDEDDGQEVVEVPDTDGKKKLSNALVAVGKIAAEAAVGVGGIGQAVGVAASKGIVDGINKIQLHNKIKDQQYRALAVILYIDGLSEFMEG
ncbi:hypothetical protein [Butyrivibrio proteoclasticus]|uniref:hypothetical protein n=1 Tax=Butyrivibrio proteoclasticus TaxID=43305 RepID=UPI001F6181CF|nr:hypothetical protein [Butyrivibrio proteoclasticus]